jgi:peroxiredoxin
MKSPTLTEVLADLRRKIGEPYSSLNDAIIKRMVEADAAALALKAGDACPDFALLNAEGELVRAQDLLARGPLVLSFYRGIWCPFCSAELEALNEAEPRIKAAGATLVAVSPEARGLPLQVKRERGFKFEILSDLDNGLALTFGLVHPVTPAFVEAFCQAGTLFPLIYGNKSWLLPLPATYIIGRDGVILHAYVNPEFRERLDPEKVVELLHKPEPPR